MPDPGDLALLVRSLSRPDLLGTTFLCGDYKREWCDDCFPHPCIEPHGCLMVGERLCCPRANLMKLSGGGDLQRRTESDTLRDIETEAL